MEPNQPVGFSKIYASAVNHKGPAVRQRMPRVLPREELEALPDNYYLSTMTRRIFRAGLRHAMVDAKWPAFDEVFHRFDPGAVMYMSDEELESLMNDRRIIRHWGKIKAVRDNARAIIALAGEHGSFARYIADWPTEDIIGLWFQLRKRCRQLGGNSAPYFLRMAGKDTFVLTKDVLRALPAWGVDAGTGRRKDELARIQQAFNRWQSESHQPLAFISMTLACSLPE